MNATIERDKKTYPEGTVFTLLKFELSEQDKQSYVGYVSQNTKTGRMNGVRSDSHYPKKICIADAKLNYQIIPGVLYRVTLIPMKSEKGYIAIEATPYQFTAVVTTTYVPKAVYQVSISFGQKTIVFDPLLGRKASRRTIEGVREQLSKRFDIANINDVIAEFDRQANRLMYHFEHDGYYVKHAQEAV